MGAPNNTYTTHPSSSRRNTCITIPIPNTPDPTYELDTNKTPRIHIYTRNPDYVYNSLLHTKALWLSLLKPPLLQCRTLYAIAHSLVLLMMGIITSETC